MELLLLFFISLFFLLQEIMVRSQQEARRPGRGIDGKKIPLKNNTEWNQVFIFNLASFIFYCF